MNGAEEAHERHPQNPVAASTKKNNER